MTTNTQNLIANEIYRLFIAYEESQKIDIDNPKHRVLNDFVTFLRGQNLSASKTTGVNPAIDKIDYEALIPELGKAVASLPDDTEWFRSKNFKKDGKELWYRVPGNADDIGGKRYHRFTQLSFEIMTGQSADQWLPRVEGIAADITGRVRNATAGTNPVTNAELLNWADDIYNIKHCIAAFFDTDAAKNIPALKLKVLEAAALCINLYDRDNGVIAEDASECDSVLLTAKIKDWLEMGLGVRFFFSQWTRFSPNFRNSLLRYIQESSGL